MPHSPVRKKLFPLYAAADAPAVQPILDALRAQGFSVSDKAPDRRGVVLLFLSDRLSDEQALSETFFRLDAKGFEIVPVNLDGTKPPELIENALYSRNTIFAERYSTEELVNRIVSAKPLQAKKSRLPLVLALGAAALLLVAAVGLVIKLLPAKETAVAEEPTPAPTAAPTEEPIPPIPEIPGVDPLSIAEVVYVGDRFVYFTWDEGYSQDDSADDMRGESAIAQSSWQDDGAHFYSKEDGQEIPFREIDASYLRYLKNLKHLTLANVRCELPDLSALSGLRRVTLSCSEIPSLAGLSGSGVQRFEYHGHTVSDFSPLSDCSALTSASLDIFLTETADFSGFHPPKLSELSIANAQDLRSPDFSWLSQCTALVRLQLDNTANLTDLTFVSGCTALERLSLRNLDLRRLDGIETLKNLRIFSMIDVSELRDISAIEGCTALEVFQMAGYPRTVYVNDLSALGKLPHLYYLSNLATGNTDLNYLKELPTKNGIVLIFASNAVTDWSGLGAIESYDYIYMNLWGDNDGMLNAAPALAYLREPVINELYLRNARNVDLSAVSHVETGLCLETCDVSDLKGGLGVDDDVGESLYDFVPVGENAGAVALLGHAQSAGFFGILMEPVVQRVDVEVLAVEVDALGLDEVADMLGHPLSGFLVGEVEDVAVVRVAEVALKVALDNPLGMVVVEPSALENSLGLEPCNDFHAFLVGVVADFPQTVGESGGVVFPCADSRPVAVADVPTGIHPPVVKLETPLEILVGEELLVLGVGVNHLRELAGAGGGEHGGNLLAVGSGSVVVEHPAAPDILSGHPVLSLPELNNGHGGADFLAGFQIGLKELLSRPNFHVAVAAGPFAAPLTGPTDSDNNAGGGRKFKVKIGKVGVGGSAAGAANFILRSGCELRYLGTVVAGGTGRTGGVVENKTVALSREHIVEALNGGESAAVRVSVVAEMKSPLKCGELAVAVDYAVHFKAGTGLFVGLGKAGASGGELFRLFGIVPSGKKLTGALAVVDE